MDDLSTALRDNPDMIFMGGSNPGRVPEVETAFQHRLERPSSPTPAAPQPVRYLPVAPGERHFRDQIADFLNRQFGWGLSAANIAVRQQRQPVSGFRALHNMFAGVMPDGGRRSDAPAAGAGA